MKLQQLLFLACIGLSVAQPGPGPGGPAGPGPDTGGTGTGGPPVPDTGGAGPGPGVTDAPGPGPPATDAPEPGPDATDPPEEGTSAPDGATAPPDGEGEGEPPTGPGPNEEGGGEEGGGGGEEEGTEGGGENLAALMGKTPEEMFEMVKTSINEMSMDSPEDLGDPFMFEANTWEFVQANMAVDIADCNDECGIEEPPEMCVTKVELANLRFYMCFLQYGDGPCYTPPKLKKIICELNSEKMVRGTQTQCFMDVYGAEMNSEL